MNKHIIRSLSIFCIVFIVIYFLLYKKTYYPSIDIIVPIPEAETLYYDIGHGFHDLFSVPIQNGKATIHNTCVNIKYIKQLGIKRDTNFIIVKNTIEDSPSILKKNFYTFDFYPEQFAKLLKISPIITVFWSLVFSSLIALAYYYYNKTQFIIYIRQNKIELLLFTSIVFFYSLIAWISYPTFNYDTIVQQHAISGKTSIVFSALYSFISESAWLLFGDPITGILALEVLCMALLMLYIYKIFMYFKLNQIALLFTLLLSISPVIYRFISMTEQREVSAIFAILSIILAIYTTITKKNLFSKTYILAVLFSFGAVAMRYDFIGYFATVILLPTLPWVTFSKFFRMITLCSILSLIAVSISFCLEYLKDPETHKYLITVHRPMPFYFGNFGYLLKKKMLTLEEEEKLLPYININTCRKAWDGYSLSSHIACAPEPQNWIVAGDIFIPIAKKYFFLHPFHYIKYHFNAIKHSIKNIFCWDKALDDYSALIKILANKTDITNPQYIPILSAYNPQYLYSMQLSPLSYSHYRKLIVSYVNNKVIRVVSFVTLLTISLYILFYTKKTQYIKIGTWRHTGEFFCLCLGPICKFISISMLAPFLVSSYFTDLMLFTFIIFPTLIAWILPLSIKINTKTSHT